MNDGGALMRRLFRQLKHMRKPMHKHLLKGALAALIALALAAPIAFMVPAIAYTIDPQVYAGTKVIPMRTCSTTQNVCYTRVTLNWNDANIKNGIWFASIPASAYILAIDADTTTAWNATTTNVLTLGVTQASANELMADCGTATACLSNSTTTIATGVVHLTTAAGLGVAVTANTSLQKAYSSSGTSVVPAYLALYAKYTQTGTAATTGSTTFVITWAKSDDN
jgi:hypothetical protein